MHFLLLNSYYLNHVLLELVQIKQLQLKITRNELIFKISTFHSLTNGFLIDAKFVKHYSYLQPNDKNITYKVHCVELSLELSLN